MLKSSLDSHLSSIQTNTAPLEGLGGWMRRAREAVDEVLVRMGGEVYDGVMGV